MLVSFSVGFIFGVSFYSFRLICKISLGRFVSDVGSFLRTLTTISGFNSLGVKLLLKARQRTFVQLDAFEITSFEMVISW